MLKITVGDIELRWDGDLTLRQVRSLLAHVAGISAMLSLPEEPTERPTISLGFTTEIAQPEEIDLSEWFEESP